MAPQEASQAIVELLRLLDETHGEVHAAAKDLSDKDAGTSPAPGRWSVLECLEHVTVVEQLFLSRLQSAERVATPAIDRQREAELLAGVSGRTQRAEAPERVRPSGRFTTCSQALQEFDSARAETKRFAEARQADLYTLAASHPRFGPLNGYEYVVIVAAHSRRHAAQAREARAALAGA